MRFLKSLLPHLTAALAAALIVAEILNEFNPRMGLLEGTPALVLIVATCVCALLCAGTLYLGQKKK